MHFFPYKIELEKYICFIHAMDSLYSQFNFFFSSQQFQVYGDVDETTNKKTSIYLFPSHYRFIVIVIYYMMNSNFNSFHQ